MTLSAGDTLGAYEILARAGAGGMGEVYKARDTRLDRTVAVKVLTSQSERFEREARTVASLNHPNICILHDIGSQNGTPYMVMEFLEGETLAARIGRGPLPLKESNREHRAKPRSAGFGPEIWAAPDVHQGCGLRDKAEADSGSRLIRDLAQVLQAIRDHSRPSLRSDC